MDNRPDVLHLVDSFNQGGSESQAVQLVRLLHGSGRYRVHVASLHPGGVLRKEVEALGIGAIADLSLTSFHDRTAVRQMLRLVSILRERGIDLVQTHDYYSNVFGLAAAAIARVPVRIGARRDTAGSRSSLQRRVQHAAYRTAHAIVANARAVEQTLVAEGVPARKIVVISNGIDSDRFVVAEDRRRSELIRLAGLPASFGGRRIVTLVANMHLAVKDQPTFLRAARRVLALHPGAGFVLAGDGILAAQHRAMAAELGLGDSAAFLGSSDRIAELLAVSDVCVLSSRSEGLPNAILEYMAAGRPVVATAVGAVAEAVVDGMTGYLVQAGDDRAMAERVQALLADPDRARAMGAAGQRLVWERFSDRTQLERTEALYSRLLARVGLPATDR